MKPFLFFVMCLFTLGFGHTQNLIMNPSFEEYWECPDFMQQLERCKYAYNPCKGTPDYHNACSSSPFATVPNAYYGYQEPRSGNAYVGLFHSLSNEIAKEYIQLSFSEELEPSKLYHFSIFVNVAGNSGWTSDFLHFKFTDTLIYYNNIYLFSIMTQMLRLPT